MATRVGIALGTNLGNRLTHLRKARDMLRQLVDPDSHYLQAPIYQSEPVDCREGAPDFYNTVIEIDYIGAPYELLAKTQGIEFHLGREAVYERNAPRIIDIDILYMGDEKMQDEILTIPHPRLIHRRFVLQPLNDICPNIILPGDEVTISEHLLHLESDEPLLNIVQSVW
ncbi:MAG: 2-amino-4-hydroxy-6-hydroxymethyldihydropteridine diphosphokinase [Cryomorphaceae bacterium]|jgi:2-amino-4-hydroxy-6-hydroxymethyldihydropteridine diphosphokinase